MLLSKGPRRSIKVKGLPQGNTTLTVCAVDTADARSCAETVLQVLPPPANFDTSAAITGSIDIAQMQATGDVGVLVQVGWLWLWCWVLLLLLA